VTKKRATTWILLALVALFSIVGLWFANRAHRAEEDAEATEERVAAAAEPAPVLNELPNQLERAPLAASQPDATPSETSLKSASSAATAPLEKGLVRLRGRVLDLTGQPVADQAVHEDGEPAHVVAHSQRDGTFATDPTPDAILLVADSANYVCLRGVQLPTPDGAIIVVAPTITVAGFVVDEVGAGIADASIAMPEASAALARFPEALDRTTPIQSVGTTSDAQGRFTYERAVGGMKLEATREGYEDGSVEVRRSHAATCGSCSRRRSRTRARCRASSCTGTEHLRPRRTFTSVKSKPLPMHAARSC
jgi:hypothetical protein